MHDCFVHLKHAHPLFISFSGSLSTPPVFASHSFLCKSKQFLYSLALIAVCLFYLSCLLILSISSLWSLLVAASSIQVRGRATDELAMANVNL